MRLTFKYRLYPTRSQRTIMNRILDACRWVYNQTLEVRRDTYQESGESVSLYDSNKMLTQWKQDNPWLSNVFSQCLQETQQRVDRAFQHFFRRVKAGETPGYPRFKGQGWYKSFTYTQFGFKLVDDKTLYLSKIGNVRINLHRPIQGNVKTLTIKRDTLGNWFACFSCEVDLEPLSPTDKVTGIDLGLTHFLTLSNGEQVPNPRFFRRDEKALAKAQRRLSQCEKDTPEYRKRLRVVQHIHNRIANRRKDFAHQLSRQLVNDYQVIVFEDLDIKDMTNGNFRGMNKSIHDAAWNQLMQYTTYKAERAGRMCLKVDPRGTTQRCSGCHIVVPKGLSDRTHDCPECGLVLDRDHNAARNVLALGLQCIGPIRRSPVLQGGE